MDKNHICGYLGVRRGCDKWAGRYSGGRKAFCILIVVVVYNSTFVENFKILYLRKVDFVKNFLSFILRRVNLTECKFYLSQHNFWNMFGEYRSWETLRIPFPQLPMIYHQDVSHTDGRGFRVSFLFCFWTHAWFHSFCGSQVWMKVSGVLCSGFYVAAIRVGADLGSHLKAQLRKNLLLCSVTFQQNPFPCTCESEGPAYLLVRGWRLIPAIRAYPWILEISVSSHVGCPISAAYLIKPASGISSETVSKIDS